MAEPHAGKSNVVTGAFGYIGRYIAAELLAHGQTVRTITTHPQKSNPFGPRVQAFPFHFDDPDLLTERLAGADRLFNTYYVRFEHAGATFDEAVANTRTLFACAKRAGVSKVIHIGVTNASLDDSLPYYRGKAQQDQALRDLGVDYAILRPTLVFGAEDILVNNIAWLLRRSPIFPVFGGGQYRIQPVFVGDLAKEAVRMADLGGRQEADIIGPESFTFERFVKVIAAKIAPRTRFFHLPARLGWALGVPIGWLLGDVLLTWNELKGLMEEKLTSPAAPRGRTAFSRWLEENKDQLGTKYTSELARHFFNS